MLLHHKITFVCLFLFVHIGMSRSAPLNPVTVKFDLDAGEGWKEDAETDCRVTIFNYRRTQGLGPEARSTNGLHHLWTQTLTMDLNDWIFLHTDCEDPAWIDRIEYTYYISGHLQSDGRNGGQGWCLSSNPNAHIGTNFEHRVNRVDHGCYKMLAIAPLIADNQRRLPHRRYVWGFHTDADWFNHIYPINSGGPPTCCWNNGRRSLEEQDAENLGTIGDEIFEGIIPLSSPDDAIMHVGDVKALVDLEICEAKKENCETLLNNVIDKQMGSNVLESAPMKDDITEDDLTNDVRQGRRKL